MSQFLVNMHGFPAKIPVDFHMGMLANFSGLVL